MEHTDISLLAEETCESLRHFASAKNITIRTKCDEGVYLDVDPVFFSKVYDNLINNAIKGMILIIAIVIQICGPQIRAYFVNRKSASNPYIVVLQCDNAENEKDAFACLAGHTKRCVVKSKTAQKDLIELNCEIRLLDDSTDFINELAAMPGVRSAVLVSYNGDYMG